MAETHVLQGRVAGSGSVVRPPGMGQVLHQRQHLVASVGPGPQPAAAGGVRIHSGSWCCRLNKLMEELVEEFGVEVSE